MAHNPLVSLWHKRCKLLFLCLPHPPFFTPLSLSVYIHMFVWNFFLLNCVKIALLSWYGGMLKDVSKPLLSYDISGNEETKTNCSIINLKNKSQEKILTFDCVIFTANALILLKVSKVSKLLWYFKQIFNRFYKNFWTSIKFFNW